MNCRALGESQIFAKWMLLEYSAAGRDDDDGGECRMQDKRDSVSGERMERLKWDREFALEQAAEDTELLEELIDIFKKSCSKDFMAIEEGVAAGDAPKVYAAAHSIKGAAASLGIEAIRDIALDIENDSRQGSLSAAQAKHKELDELLRLLQRI